MCRGIASLVGCLITDVATPECSCRPCLIDPPLPRLSRQMVGKRVSGIERRGKRVILLLEDDSRLVIEPRMSGLVLIGDPPDNEHLRLKITLSTKPAVAGDWTGPTGKHSAGGGKVASRDGNVNSQHSSKNLSDRVGERSRLELLVWDRRGLGTIRWMSEDSFGKLVDRRLGPDALEVDAATLRAALSASRRAIKVALLDQSVVAGVGNLYASEICFVSGVDPRTRCDRLTRPQWHRIGEAIRLVLEEAIRHEGSTLSDGTYRNALNAPGNYQSQHRVYDRAGWQCVRCEEGTIRRIVQAQRSTFFCPLCQRRSGRHRSILPSAFERSL